MQTFSPDSEEVLKFQHITSHCRLEVTTSFPCLPYAEWTVTMSPFSSCFSHCPFLHSVSRVCGVGFLAAATPGYHHRLGTRHQQVHQHHHRSRSIHQLLHRT